MSVVPTDNLTSQLDRHLFAPLAKLRRRGRLYLGVEGVFQIVFAMIAAGFVQLMLDRSFKLAVDQRAVLNALIVLFWLWTVYRSFLLRVARPLSDAALAVIVDRRNPRLQDRVATAVQFAAGKVGDAATASPDLVRAVLRDACDAAAGVRFLDVLDHRRARRRGAETLALLGLVVVAFAMAPALMGTYFQRNWLLQDVAWPKRTHIHPVGFDSKGRRRMPRGDELEVVAKISGNPPPTVTATLRWWTESGRRGRERMTQLGDTRLEVSLGQLTEDVHFRIVGDDERTREFVVEAVERPRIVQSLARITPPEYTGLDPISFEQSTVLEVLRGSTLEIEVRLNKPVREARFVGSEGPVAPCELIALGGAGGEMRAGDAGESAPVSAGVRVCWQEPASGSYHFELVDADGLRNRRPVRFNIKLVPDQAPDVRMELAGVGEYITPRAELPIDLRFEDAYGLSAIELWLSKDQEPPREIPLEGFEPRRREFQVAVTLAVKSIGLSPGQRLTVWARAEDLDPLGPNVGQAQPVELTVLSWEDFLTEMARRELELRREFERLIAAQRALREALEQAVVDLPVDTAPPARVAQRFAGLSRRQDAHAGRCSLIAREYGRILAEMQTSKAARPGDERRMRDRIMRPLGTLAGATMSEAGALIAALRQGATAEQRARLETAQAEILRRMKEILANMLEWEGYREAVALLREIIASQGEMRSATVEALETQLEEILGALDDPDDNSKPPPRKP